MNVTPRDELIMTTLTHKVRCMTDRQVSEFVTGRQDHSEGLVRRLRLLRRNGFLFSERVVVCLVELVAPLVAWFPGDVEPGFDRLAWRLHSRLASACSHTVNVFWASEKAVRMVGGVGGHLRQPHQVQHDLGTAAMLIRCSLRDDHATDRWISEDLFRCHPARPPRSKIPDAVEISPDGRLARAFEFGGDYSADRLRRFHRFCSRLRLPYELW